MSYTSGISGGSGLQDFFRYQKALASHQNNATQGSASAWPDIAQGPSPPPASSPTASTTAGSSQTQSGTSNAVSGSGASLSSELSNLLMQFQQVLSQFEQASGATDGAQTAGSSGSTASTGTSTDATATTTAATTATAAATDSTQAAATQPTPHHHHHHHHAESQSQSASSAGQDSASTAANGSQSDPLAQLLGTAANSSDGSGAISQSAFEQDLFGGKNVARADKLFGKLDTNGDGTIDQSEAQNVLKQFSQSQNASGAQSLFGGNQTGGQGNSSQSSWLSGAGLMLMAQQMGQAA